ncbi:ABC transporter permease [Cohnella zeiphila]
MQNKQRASVASKRWMKQWPYYVLLAPALIYFLIFHYYPMYGVQIAFKNFLPSKGVWDSPWVGFAHFERFFNSYYFWTLIKNTVFISLYQLAFFPASILVALSINELRNDFFKKWVQTITYAPHFISTVVISGMIISFLSPFSGIVNKLIEAIGGGAIPFMTDPAWFKSVYVISGEWQNFGWGAIIYLAALAGINPELHEAAMVDGASRFKRIFYINVPGILPVIVILFILNMGSFISLGFEKIILLQNAMNMDSSDVIQTYVYRAGIQDAQYSFASAVGLFNSAVNIMLLVTFNQIARRLNDTSLW